MTENNLNLIFPILFSELTAGWHYRKGMKILIYWFSALAVA
jgi:hypothetical protein